MDPDALLAKIREHIASAREDESIVSDTELELVELVESLDGWLSQSGFLPGAWDTAARKWES